MGFSVGSESSCGLAIMLELIIRAYPFFTSTSTEYLRRSIISKAVGEIPTVRCTITCVRVMCVRCDLKMENGKGHDEKPRSEDSAAVSRPPFYCSHPYQARVILGKGCCLAPTDDLHALHCTSYKVTAAIYK